MKVKNFTQRIVMEKKSLEFKDRMTANQFAFICNLRKKQIGKVKMSYVEIKKYLTKTDATKLIDLLTYEYYDIDVVLRGTEKRKDNTPITLREVEGLNQMQKTMTQLDMLNTKLKTLNT